MVGRRGRRSGKFKFPSPEFGVLGPELHSLPHSPILGSPPASTALVQCSPSASTIASLVSGGGRPAMAQVEEEGTLALGAVLVGGLDVGRPVGPLVSSCAAGPVCWCYM